MTPSQLRTLCQQAADNHAYPIIAPEIILALLDSVEGLSLNHPDNTADCQSLALDHLAAIGRVAALESENAILRGYINAKVNWSEVEKLLVDK